MVKGAGLGSRTSRYLGSLGFNHLAGFPTRRGYRLPEIQALSSNKPEINVPTGVPASAFRFTIVSPFLISYIADGQPGLSITTRPFCCHIGPCLSGKSSVLAQPFMSSKYSLDSIPQPGSARDRARRACMSGFLTAVTDLIIGWTPSPSLSQSLFTHSSNDNQLKSKLTLAKTGAVKRVGGAWSQKDPRPVNSASFRVTHKYLSK